MTGVFVAVVGPSGSGKDSIIEHTRTMPEIGGGIVFPRRQITRPAGIGEDHDPVTEDEFDAAESRGDYALTWHAHGLRYGIPFRVVDVVETGGVVVANLSRGVLGQLSAVFANVRIVRITVSDQVRLARIVARGREGEAAAAARVARPDPAPGHPVDLEIVNDATLEEASEELAAFLTHVLRATPA